MSLRRTTALIAGEGLHPAALAAERIRGRGVGAGSIAAGNQRTRDELVTFIETFDDLAVDAIGDANFNRNGNDFGLFERAAEFVNRAGADGGFGTLALASAT